jgi:hypothetical protein
MMMPLLLALVLVLGLAETGAAQAAPPASTMLDAAHTFLAALDPAPGRRPCHWRRNWVHAADELPGVSEGDMSIEDNQRKHGTTRGSPRRRG